MLVLALGALAAGAALAVYLRLEKAGPAGLPLAVLRAVAWGAVAALLVDPGCRHAAGGAAPVVLLDHSLSMTDPGPEPAALARWRAALDTARRAAGRSGSVLLFGAQPAALRGDAPPDAPATRLLPAWREAASLGGPVTVVTDGEVDDARDLPPDFDRLARVVVLPRPPRPDAGVAGFDLPLALRAGDTATASVVVVAAGTAPSDTATLELREGARVAARTRIALGAGGSFRRELRFVPAAPPAGADREVRRYEARLAGVPDDAEPRDDARASLAEVARTSAIAVLSDSPDWDFRTLVATLRQTAGVPVSAFVRIAPGGPWRDAASLGPVTAGAVEAAARGASLVVVHGTPAGTAPMAGLARHGLWRWTASPAGALAGDWYVLPTAAASPLGAALAGVPPDSLPPLEALSEVPADTSGWTGLAARLARRGRAWPAVSGGERGGLRLVRMLGSGFWRWSSKGGVAAEGYRSLVAAVTDWLLAEPEGAGAALAARRDSLNRGLDELLPRPRTLESRAGLRAAVTAETEPLRRNPLVYGVALAALVLEWVGRRRRGMR
ncbi:MAG TPA: hypothetical protein VEH62_10190 [Gemmatimonadales bacterium]|nr:hypothetical protein [Gemmatimonadales bacterium]